MNDIIAHLSADKKLKSIIDHIGTLELSPQKNIYLKLCGSIMSQQLSTKVADVIYKRFEALFGNKTPKPQQIIDIPDEQLRAIGLSNAKVGYIKNVCRFFIEHKITDKKLHTLDDHEVIELLTQIKGVGQWTVEMILMFGLGRENVFAVDDLGIQQAMCGLYNINPADKKKMKEAMIKRSRNWEPYRTYACRYLWRWKDGI